MSSLAAIEAEARHQMRRHGLYGWGFKFDRAVKRQGCCSFSRHLITLSGPLCTRAPWDEVVDTILHEIAHALVGPAHGHNETWRRKALELGCNGKRCSDVAIAPLPARWKAVCPGCSRVFHKHRLVRPNARRWCRRCGPEKGSIAYKLTDQSR